MWSRWSDIDRMFNAMNLLQSRMDNIFGDYSTSRPIPAAWIAAESMPKTNLNDLGDHFEVVAEVPGFKKENLNIKIQGNYLEIGGTHQSDTPENYAVHRVERGTTSFNRSFTLPSDVNSEKVEASLKNGLLVLTLPKAEAAKPKQITVK
jgi:HSP20 family protein